MHVLRALLLRNRSLALLLVAAALCLKAAMPGGTMIGIGETGAAAKVLTVQVCHPAGISEATRQVTIPMKQAPKGGDRASDHCAYTSLSMAAISGAEPALLALAIAFVIALGFTATRLPARRRIARLRPPLRGPPSPA